MFPYHISYGVLARTPMFLVAWYTANSMAFAGSSTTSTINTANNATLEGLDIQVPLAWVATAVDLSGTDGKTMVWDETNNRAVEASNDTSLYKAGLGELTIDTTAEVKIKNSSNEYVSLTSVQAGLLENKTFNVTIKSNTQLRVAGSVTGSAGVDSTSKAPNANTYVAYNDSNPQLYSYAAGQIKFTSVALTAANSGKYKIATAQYADTILNTALAAGTKLTFYYSISPKNTSGTEGVDPGTGYGNIWAEFAQA